MNIYAIIADDRQDSLLRDLARVALEGLAGRGNQVTILDLYEHAAEIPFYHHKVVEDGKQVSPLEHSKFFTLNKQHFMQADRLFIAHPVYWYSVPGIMKAWIDLITNYAWKFEDGTRAQALHKIQKALVLNTSMQPTARFWNHHASRQLKKTFKWMGVPQVLVHEVGDVYSLSAEDVNKHHEAVASMAQKLIS